MTDEMPQRRKRFQFSIRKLLIWTAILAAWCAFWKVGGGPWYGFAVLTVWVIAVASSRLVWNTRVAVIVSLVAAAISAPLLLLSFPPAPYQPVAVFVDALIVVLLAEGGTRFVNWLDKLIEKKTARRE